MSDAAVCMVTCMLSLLCQSASRKERALSYAFTHAVYAYKLLWPANLCYDWGFRCEGPPESLLSHIFVPLPTCRYCESLESVQGGVVLKISVGK